MLTIGDTIASGLETATEPAYLFVDILPGLKDGDSAGEPTAALLTQRRAFCLHRRSGPIRPFPRCFLPRSYQHSQRDRIQRTRTISVLSDSLSRRVRRHCTCATYCVDQRAVASRQ